jgi:hypothetical protein
MHVRCAGERSFNTATEHRAHSLTSHKSSAERQYPNRKQSQQSQHVSNDRSDCHRYQRIRSTPKADLKRPRCYSLAHYTVHQAMATLVEHRSQPGDSVHQTFASTSKRPPRHTTSQTHIHNMSAIECIHITAHSTGISVGFRMTCLKRHQVCVYPTEVILADGDRRGNGAAVRHQFKQPTSREQQLQSANIDPVSVC